MYTSAVRCKRTAAVSSTFLTQLLQNCPEAIFTGFRCIVSSRYSHTTSYHNTAVWLFVLRRKHTAQKYSYFRLALTARYHDSILGAASCSNHNAVISYPFHAGADHRHKCYGPPRTLKSATGLSQALSISVPPQILRHQSAKHYTPHTQHLSPSHISMHLYDSLTKKMKNEEGFISP